MRSPSTATFTSASIDDPLRSAAFANVELDTLRYNLRNCFDCLGDLVACDLGCCSQAWIELQLPDRLFIGLNICLGEALKVDKQIGQLEDGADGLRADFPLSAGVTVSSRLGGNRPRGQSELVRLDALDVLAQHIGERSHRSGDIGHRIGSQKAIAQVGCELAGSGMVDRSPLVAILPGGGCNDVELDRLPR